MRRLLQEKGDNLQAPPRQERPHGVPAMWECVGRFGRGRRRCEMPLLSPAASLQLWGALSPGLGRNNIALPLSHGNKAAPSCAIPQGNM